MLHYINFHNPHFRSSYYNPLDNHYRDGYSGYPNYQDLVCAEALAAQRARRAQYLPHEDVDSDEYLLNPREKMYLNALRRQEVMRRRGELGYQRQTEEARRLEERRQYIEEARRRQAEEVERIFQERMQRAQRSPSRSSSVDHQNSSHYTSPPRTHGEQSQEPPTPPAFEYSQVHHNAATKMQQRYRQQRALRAIDNTAFQFEETRKNFTLPETIDFLHSTKPSEPSADEKTITVNTVPETYNTENKVSPNLDVSDDKMKVAGDVSSASMSRHEETHTSYVDDEARISDDGGLEDTTPRLAYTKQNHSLHEYMEKLNVLLIKLDGVESFGSRKVRDRRKEVVGRIEKEAARVETFVKTAWREYTYKH